MKDLEVWCVIVAVIVALGIQFYLYLWRKNREWHIKGPTSYIDRSHATPSNFHHQPQTIPGDGNQKVATGQGDLLAAIANLQPLIPSVMQLREIPGQIQGILHGLTMLHTKAADCDRYSDAYTQYYSKWENCANELAVEKQQNAQLREQKSGVVAECVNLNQELANWSKNAEQKALELMAANEKIAQLENEKETVTRQYEAAGIQNVSLRSDVATVEAERDELRSHSQRLAASLPVEDIERIYSAVMDKCAVTESDAPNLRYVFSQITVLAATRSLDIDADDKPILLRDAFNAFDLALYARFKREKDRLQSLRECFSDLLKPLLAGALAFEWPAPGNDLDLKRHKPEEENGLGVIQEVKSAVLFTSSGAVIAKAVVLT